MIKLILILLAFNVNAAYAEIPKEGVYTHPAFLCKLLVKKAQNNLALEWLDSGFSVCREAHEWPLNSLGKKFTLEQSSTSIWKQGQEELTALDANTFTFLASQEVWVHTGMTSYVAPKIFEGTWEAGWFGLPKYKYNYAPVWGGENYQDWYYRYSGYFLEEGPHLKTHDVLFSELSAKHIQENKLCERSLKYAGETALKKCIFQGYDNCKIISTKSEIILNEPVKSEYFVGCRAKAIVDGHPPSDHACVGRYTLISSTLPERAKHDFCPQTYNITHHNIVTSHHLSDLRKIMGHALVINTKADPHDLMDTSVVPYQYNPYYDGDDRIPKLNVLGLDFGYSTEQWGQDKTYTVKSNLSANQADVSATDELNSQEFRWKANCQKTGIKISFKFTSPVDKFSGECSYKKVGL